MALITVQNTLSGFRDLQTPETRLAGDIKVRNITK